jgi:hypothetical protein
VRHVIIVRLGEKRILTGALEILSLKEAALNDVGDTGYKGKKRVVSSGTTGGEKSKRVRH